MVQSENANEDLYTAREAIIRNKLREMGEQAVARLRGRLLKYVKDSGLAGNVVPEGALVLNHEIKKFVRNEDSWQKYSQQYSTYESNELSLSIEMELRKQLGLVIDSGAAASPASKPPSQRGGR